MLSFTDFIFGRVIGAGSFGRVHIALHRASGLTFAIKAMSKAACIKAGQVRAEGFRNADQWRPLLAIKERGLRITPHHSQVKHALDERKLLGLMHHPFLVRISFPSLVSLLTNRSFLKVRLQGTFQDADTVYLVMDFVAGGEFFTMLRDKGRLREEHAR